MEVITWEVYPWGMEFEFDGRHGSELGLYVIHDDGLFERQFGLSRDTNTDKIRGHGKPYLYSTDNTVLSGTLMFLLGRALDVKNKREPCQNFYLEILIKISSPRITPILSTRLCSEASRL